MTDKSTHRRDRRCVEEPVFATTAGFVPVQLVGDPGANQPAAEAHAAPQLNTPAGRRPPV